MRQKTHFAKSCFYTLNAVYQEQPLSPEVYASMLNQMICDSCQGKLLMTMCIVQINLATGDLVVCNAGHESPFHVKGSEANSGGKKPKVDTLFARGERLGFDRESVYEMEHFHLESGDSLLLYTDGISEAHDKSGSEWGERSLKKAFAKSCSLPAEEIKQELIAGVEKHTNGAELKDDITFVVVQYLGSEPVLKKPPTLGEAA
jgi:sigma-B regulation protein RsbU (phosphoserine phosphatase)